MLWKATLRLALQASDPELECRLSRGEEPSQLLERESVRERNGREACRVKNLIGVRVADSAKNARIR